MTPRERQEAEIKTIKPRGITINLSDADVERLFGKTYVNGITPSELIEGFLGDLIDGTYSNGSDERMLADEYFERCCYGMGADYTFLRWALECEYYDNIIDLIDDRDFCVDVLAAGQNGWNARMTPEEIKNEIAEFKEDLQRFEHEILSYYNEYDIYYNGYDGKTRLGRKPQPLEDGIEEMRQYRRALDEMLQSMSGSGESEECAEDDEQFEPYRLNARKGFNGIDKVAP